jgi:hypothetical protein
MFIYMKSKTVHEMLRTLMAFYSSRGKIYCLILSKNLKLMVQFFELLLVINNKFSLNLPLQWEIINGMVHLHLFNESEQ